MRYAVALICCFAAFPALADGVQTPPDAETVVSYWRARADQAGNEAAQTAGMVITLRKEVATLQQQVADAKKQCIEAPAK